jgi:hypothetical protein
LFRIVSDTDIDATQTPTPPVYRPVSPLRGPIAVHIQPNEYLDTHDVRPVSIVRMSHSMPVASIELPVEQGGAVESSQSKAIA